MDYIKRNRKRNKTRFGILDKKRVLQRKLNTIAETADTSISWGLKKLLNAEVSKALLQHHDSCHFVYFLERCNCSMEDSLMPFYRLLAITERKRYDKETFMNVDGVKLERTYANKANSIDNEYSVATVLVLARGRYIIPSLTVDRTLQTLCSIPRTKKEAVEVLWSPQSEGDTVSEQELHGNFMHMRCYYDKEKINSAELVGEVIKTLWIYASTSHHINISVKSIVGIRKSTGLEKEKKK